MPVKNAVRLTMESERQPICSSCSAMVRHSGGRRSAAWTASRVSSATAPSPSSKATTPVGQGAARTPESGVRAASAPVMGGSYRRGEGSVKSRRPGARRNAVHGLQHDAVEEEEAHEEREDVVGDAEEQDGD